MIYVKLPIKFQFIQLWQKSQKFLFGKNIFPIEVKCEVVGKTHNIYYFTVDQAFTNKTSATKITDISLFLYNLKKLVLY